MCANHILLQTKEERKANSDATSAISGILGPRRSRLLIDYISAKNKDLDNGCISLADWKILSEGYAKELLKNGPVRKAFRRMTPIPDEFFDKFFPVSGEKEKALLDAVNVLDPPPSGLTLAQFDLAVDRLISDLAADNAKYRMGLSPEFFEDMAKIRNGRQGNSGF